MTTDELDKVDEDVDLEVGLTQLDAMHENWLVSQANIEQEIVELLGPKYSKYKLLMERRSMLDKEYSDRKDKLRREILAPAILSRQHSVYSRFFRIEYAQGSENVNRPALREWADSVGLRERVENFISRAAPFIKIVSIKGE